MPDKVLIPKCIKCDSKTLTADSRTTTVQIDNRLPPPFIQEVSYRICHRCINKCGTIVRIWKRPGEPDIAYFSKDRSVGVPLKEAVLLKD